LRAVITHQPGAKSGLSEFEAWGEGALPLVAAPVPPGNLAAAVAGQEYPKSSASFTSQYDDVKELNDGVSAFAANPRNRWTAYESPNESDWVAIDFGAEKTVGRVDLHIYDDGGGVQAPKSYAIQSWDGSRWVEVQNVRKDPAKPAGGKINSATFPALRTSKVCVVFRHNAPARSGLTELEIWAE
jgi:hypothetical protein